MTTRRAMKRGSSPDFEHARQPVDRRVRIAAAHALDEGAGDVVMGVAGRVEVHDLALDRLLGHLQRELDRRAAPLARRQHADLQGASAPGGRRRRRSRRGNRARRPGHASICCQGRAPCRPAPRASSVLICSVGQRLEREDLAAAQERRVDGEERVLRRRADQDDAAFLDVGQQHVLLRAVEAVQFIDEQDGAPAGVGQLGAGFFEQLAHFLDADGDGVELAKDALRVLGDDVGQRGLAAAGRAVEDDRTRADPPAAAGAAACLRPRKCSWPTNSSSVRGRIRAASGWARLQVRFMGFAEEVDGCTPSSSFSARVGRCGARCRRHFRAALNEENRKRKKTAGALRCARGFHFIRNRSRQRDVRHAQHGATTNLLGGAEHADALAFILAQRAAVAGHEVGDDLAIVADQAPRHFIAA